MKKHIFPFLLLTAYLFLLIKILVVKDLAMVRVGHMRFNFGGTQEGPANLIPFKTIIYYIQGSNGLLIACINIIGNIIALVPLGLLVPCIFPNINWKKSVMLAGIAGVSIEFTQLFLHIGIFDIDDVLLNGIGVIIGFWIFTIFSKFSKKGQSIISAISIGIAGLFILLLTLSYYQIWVMPVGIEPGIESAVLSPLKNTGQVTQSDGCCDLCNGTGGTGKIISIGENAITIRSKKGVNEVIRITDRTTLKNSRGDIAKTTLKIGDSVTVVIDETENASLILVCGIAKK